MKKVLFLLLACLMLTSCAENTANSPTTPSAEQTLPEETSPYEAEQPTLSPTEPENEEDILAYRREVVVAEMRRTMATLWTPEEDIVYYLKNPDTFTEDNDPITLKAGRIYQGLPYTHGSGSAYGFFSYASSEDENGVYTISGLTPTHLTGENSNLENSRARQGCDCADTVFWSWGRVSSSISFTYTGEMTEKYGCLPVGDYFCDLPKLTSSTKTVTTANGEGVMFDAYAQIQPGDAMVLYTKASGGHAVMVVDSHIEYTDDGIDGENSYVVIIEQKSSPQREEQHYYSEELDQDIYICGAVDSKWTFNEIFKKGYLPVTCKELIDAAPKADETVSTYSDNPTISNLWTDSIKSNYRIASVTVTILQNGKTVQKATSYGRQKEQRNFSMLAFKDPMEQDMILGGLNIDALEAGEYQCVVTCLLSTGNRHTAFDFTFTK